MRIDLYVKVQKDLRIGCLLQLTARRLPDLANATAAFSYNNPFVPIGTRDNPSRHIQRAIVASCNLIYLHVNGVGDFLTQAQEQLLTNQFGKPELVV